jgi:hypothetical protein
MRFIIILFSFLSLLRNNNLLAQNSTNCAIKPKIELLDNKSYPEGYNIRAVDLMANDRESLQSTKTNKVVIFHFYFDETNKFHNTAESYLKLLKDSLSSLSTDIEIQIKIQKTKGSIFIKNGKNTLSVIHLNALVYSNDQQTLNELFGIGGRIDTTTTRTKAFNHEFLSIQNMDSTNQDLLYLFRAKILGKSFACDPNEDKDILKYFKKVYAEKYVKKCQKDFEEKEKQQIEDTIRKLSEENRALNEYKSKIEKKRLQAPKFGMSTDINRQFGSVSLYSSFFGQDVNFNSHGLSVCTGGQYFVKDIYQSGILFNAGIIYFTSNYITGDLLNAEFHAQQVDYLKINNLSEYSESIESSTLLIPIGIGYQFRKETSPIFVQVSTGLNFGLGRVSATSATGKISYSRYYEVPGIEVMNQPSLGLVSNVSINHTPFYEARTGLFFGAFASAKLNYRFPNNSPISGYLNVCYNSIQTNLVSNGSEFISTELNSYNSILNSIEKFKLTPFQLGIGVVYELRKKITL